jgi:hypothetical protein
MIDNQFSESELKGIKPKYIPLQVSSGILLHIGAGIYNSVAGAIKELVSNAYDADASSVTIMTNYHDFDKIVVVDNGSGMTIETFSRAMGSIGSSLKRELHDEGLTPIHHRPIIGHLGIGLMALSQVCDVAIVESQVENAETRFLAKLDFSSIRTRTNDQIVASTLEILGDRSTQKKQMGRRSNSGGLAKNEKTKTDLESAQFALAKDAHSLATQDKYTMPDKEHLGYCIIYPGLPAIPGGQGTRITLHPLEPAVIAAFNDQNRDIDALPSSNLPDEYKLPADSAHKDKDRKWEEEKRAWQHRRDELNMLDWRTLCEELRLGTLSYERLPQYHQFLWQLAMMSPIPYFEDGPVTLEPVLRDERTRISGFKFSLIVDNRELFKPILLPSAKLAQLDQKSLRNELDYHIETFSHVINVSRGKDKSELKFTGYIYWQSSQNKPSQIRGIQIYIRNVGIGLYDHSLLNFSTVNPTSRGGQISGEIYIHKGLEQALNIDRNSFRETDPDYIALQRYIWQMLGSTKIADGVLGGSVLAYQKRRELKDKDDDKKHMASLRQIIEQVSSGKVSVELSRTKADEKFVREGKYGLVVNVNASDWPRKITERQRAQRILIALKIAAMSGSSADDLVELADKLLTEHS